MAYFVIIGIALLAMLVLNFTKHREIMRISWDKVAQFCGFMALLTFARIASYDFLLQSGLSKSLPGMYPEIMSSKWTLMLVFWEDMFFGVPLYFIHKYWNGKITRYLKWPVTIAMSLLFGLGHSYQGWQGVALTSLLPFFISKGYGEKYGFGTVMVCHILYDNITVYSILMLPYLLGVFH